MAALASGKRDLYTRFINIYACGEKRVTSRERATPGGGERNGGKAEEEPPVLGRERERGRKRGKREET